MKNCTIYRKLNNEKGASIIIALFLLMLCSVLSAVIITAASANAGKSIYVEEEDQAYLDVRSAVWLMRDSSMGACCQKKMATETTYAEGSVTGSHSLTPQYTICGAELSAIEDSQNLLFKTVPAMLGKMAKYIMENNESQNYPESQVLIITSDAGDSGVKVTVEMDSDYAVTMRFNRLERGSTSTTAEVNFPMTLTLQPNNPADRNKQQIEYPSATPENGTKITYSFYEVEWVSYEITKGV